MHRSYCYIIADAVMFNYYLHDKNMGDKQTKIINFYQLKGGVGKTTLTLMVANELIWQSISEKQTSPEPTYVNDPLKVLVLDIDTQNSISVLREEEIQVLEAAATHDEERFNRLIEKKPWQKTLFSRYEYLYSTYGWKCFDEIMIHPSESSVNKAVELIQSNEYDYVFMDFPGSYDQQYTGELLLYSQFLFIPCDLNSQLDVAAARKFLTDMLTVQFHDLRHIAFIANKHRFDSIRNKRNQELIEEATEIPFLQTKIKYCEYFKTEHLTTVYPKSVDLNLNTKQVSLNPHMNSIVELAREIKSLEI